MSDWENGFVEKFGYLDQKGKPVTGEVILFIRSLLSTRDEWLKSEIEKMKRGLVIYQGADDDPVKQIIWSAERHQDFGHDKALDRVLALLNSKKEDKV